MDIFIAVVLSLLGLCVLFVTLVVVMMYISIKKQGGRVRNVLSTIMLRADAKFLSTLEVVADTDVTPHCEVTVNDEKTVVTSLGRDYSFFNSHFPGGAGFDRLFDIIFHQLRQFEKCVCKKTFCIKCCFDAPEDSKAMNDYQMIRAIFCAIYAFGIIHKTSTLLTVKVVIDPKHDYAVNEILRDKNYQGFYSCDGSTPGMNDYIEKYSQDS